MTTSGSTDYSRNALQIITAALRKNGSIDAAASASGADLTTGLEALNLLIKTLQLEDIKLWFYQEVVLHLTKDSQSYTLGPSGSHCCLLSDSVKTQLSAAAAAGASTITVDSITGIAASDKIGVELDDGTLQWTTVNGAPSGSTVTLTAVLTGAATADNYVFAHTNYISRPLELIEARLRDTDDNDQPLKIHTDQRGFMQITDKTSTGDVTDLLLTPHITNATLYAFPVADDVSKRIIMTIQRVVEDFDNASGTDDADFPPETQEALVWNLALRIGPEYGGASQEVKSMAAYTLGLVKDKYGKRENIFLRPAARRRR